uniref:Uncharacterized protein n=1 Tax=Eutreptiella gymnastica TaxID=73025 RepID=A0A7S1IHX6_9EUGL
MIFSPIVGKLAGWQVATLTHSGALLRMLLLESSLLPAPMWFSHLCTPDYARGNPGSRIDEAFGYRKMGPRGRPHAIAVSLRVLDLIICEPSLPQFNPRL